MAMRVSIINWLQTTKHKLWVAYYLIKVCKTILKRGIVHDLSKYTKYEAPYFAKSISDLQGLEYGSEEYKAALERLGPALYHHYRNNTHHPEYWNGNIDEMSPPDQLEMLCDWKAAGRRHKTGNMKKSLEVNRERFKASRWFYDALERDAKEIDLI